MELVNFQEKLIFNIKNGYEQNQGSVRKEFTNIEKKKLGRQVGWVYIL